jgi:hypothetical protein
MFSQASLYFALAQTSKSLHKADEFEQQQRALEPVCMQGRPGVGNHARSPAMGLMEAGFHMMPVTALVM